MSARHSWLVAAGVALTMAAPMSAQQGPRADVAVWPVGTIAHITTPAPDFLRRSASESGLIGPRLLLPASDKTALGLRLMPASAPGLFMAPVQAQGGRRGPVALMVVGGAALVVGSLIDGDTGTIVMLGGGTIGLIGLYRYLR